MSVLRYADVVVGRARRRVELCSTTAAGAQLGDGGRRRVSTVLHRPRCGASKAPGQPRLSGGGSSSAQWRWDTRRQEAGRSTATAGARLGGGRARSMVEAEQRASEREKEMVAELFAAVGC
jgi:hypothetical protein